MRDVRARFRPKPMQVLEGAGDINDAVAGVQSLHRLAALMRTPHPESRRRRESPRWRRPDFDCVASPAQPSTNISI
jgi:hypothetical protein